MFNVFFAIFGFSPFNILFLSSLRPHTHSLLSYHQLCLFPFCVSSINAYYHTLHKKASSFSLLSCIVFHCVCFFFVFVLFCFVFYLLFFASLHSFIFENSDGREGCGDVSYFCGCLPSIWAVDISGQVVMSDCFSVPVTELSNRTHHQHEKIHWSAE